MSLPVRLLLPLTIVALLASLIFGTDSRGQVELPLRNQPDAAVSELPVIAHGMVTLPAGEIGWNVVLRRTVPPYRASATPQSGAFVLAQEGAIAVTDADGHLLYRLAPGEAVWVVANTDHAVVSLEDRAVDYVEIALRPAANLGERGQSLAIGLPFAAPEGAALPLKLMRGELDRDAEGTIGTGTTPSLLLVTRGAVWTTLPTGESRQLTTGAVMQLEGDIVLTGASRTPASFVVARVGAPLPAHFTLKNGTPEPQSVPAATPGRDATGTDAATIPADTDTDTESDGDGLTDRDEVEFYGTDALVPDTDGDGLDDGEELLVFSTNPLLADTDGDGVLDGEETALGADPLDAASLPVADVATPAAATPSSVAGPNLGPGTEATPAATDALPPGDLDGDGLANADEVEIYGTNPEIVDSDGDGFSDGGEVMAGTDAIDPLSPP